MKTRQSKPSRFWVDIWVQGRGFDVTALNTGETGLRYTVRIRTHRGRKKTLHLKSIAVGSNPLVVFSHATPQEWTCKVQTVVNKPGISDFSIDVDKVSTGSSTLQALELVFSAPIGNTTESVVLDLPLTVV
jgi:hypothetical protein